MTDNITDIAEIIGKLSVEQRSELIAKVTANAAPKGKMLTFSESLLASANNPSRLGGLHLLRSILARFSIKFDESKKCDLASLNQEMKAQGVPADARWEIKSLMYLNHLIDA
jgi:hypothetical protein